jgi:hypothetical protein
MIAAREKEREYFESSPDYAHLASRMGSEHLAKLLSEVPEALNLISWTYIQKKLPRNLQSNFITTFQHLESVIKARIPSITAVINKTIDELESELDTIGRAVAADPGVSHLYHISIINEIMVVFSLIL